LQDRLRLKGGINSDSIDDKLSLSAFFFIYVTSSHTKSFPREGTNTSNESAKRKTDTVFLLPVNDFSNPLLLSVFFQFRLQYH